MQLLSVLTNIFIEQEQIDEAVDLFAESQRDVSKGLMIW